MGIHKVLKIVILSLIIIGINTRVSYSTQSITVIPNEKYYPTGTTGETFEFSLDTNNYVYASNSSGSSLTVNNWVYPGFGQWTGGVYTRQWIPNIVTPPGQYFVVSVSGYYMPKGRGKGEGRWIQFTSTANNTVIKPYIGVSADDTVLIVDTAGRPAGAPKTSIITAKVLGKDNKVLTDKTGAIRFEIPNMTYGALLDLNDNPVTSVDVVIKKGKAEANFKAGTTPSGSSPVIVTAKDAATPSNMTEGYTSITVDPILDHVGITVYSKGEVLIPPYKASVGTYLTFISSSYISSDNSVQWDTAIHERVTYTWIIDGIVYTDFPIITDIFSVGNHIVQLTGMTRSLTTAFQSKSTTINIEVYSVDYIKISPLNGYVVVGGKKIVFTAYGFWNGPDGQPNTTDDVNLGVISVNNWITSVSSNIGTIDTFGVFTSGTNSGNGTVTATYNFLTANANVYVKGVDYIKVFPENGYAAVGGGYVSYAIKGYWNGVDGISNTTDDELLFGDILASSWSTSVPNEVGTIDILGKFTPGITPGNGTSNSNL